MILQRQNVTWTWDHFDEPDEELNQLEMEIKYAWTIRDPTGNISTLFLSLRVSELVYLKY